MDSTAFVKVLEAANQVALAEFFGMSSAGEIVAVN